MKTIDCLGDMCPIPIIKIKKEIKNTNKGESFKTVTDHSCVVASINEHFKNNNKVTLTSEEVINGIWEITITIN